MQKFWYIFIFIPFKNRLQTDRTYDIIQKNAKERLYVNYFYKHYQLFHFAVNVYYKPHRTYQR